ncbi:hypothetical protein [Robiginitomaculum antarcticum]|uniref:hypothetical protein n=1 Tax=Robiginitomaculum antarcticum TaxID=437507 RepID=UPI0003752D0B|nr:hypothetical protein [Robiginitomaculum antarcticum]
MKTFSLIAFAAILAACSAKPAPQDAFMDKIQTYCGKAYAGKLVSTDTQDADMAGANMVMHVRECSDTEVKISFNVDDNRSRTWVMTDTGEGLRLKHDHRHEDGSEDAVTQYGGDTDHPGTDLRQNFPVDQYSIDMFNENGLEVSTTNVWAFYFDDDQETLTYEMTRPYKVEPKTRLFQVQFDMSEEIATPDASWGHE